MSGDRHYYIYILANKWNTVTYVGVTNNLIRRVYEHREHLIPGFTERYSVTKLVYYEMTDDPEAAIAREKQLKGGSRKQKVALIERMNPKWEDLYAQITA
ncbi:MAG: GIY-YIG nuclease family protein [bacterium]|nr:GIY-YIG nuclease family protein [bacterium]